MRFIRSIDGGETMKRRSAVFVAFLCVLLIAQDCFGGMGRSWDGKVVNRVPDHLPIKIEIINPISNDTLKNVRIKVTNVGNRPIYFLKFFISTSEDFLGPGGSQFGFALKYGRPDLITFGELATPDDIPIRTGEWQIFAVKPAEAKNFKENLRNSFRAQPDLYLLEFQFLSFGDATGFWGSTGKAFPAKTISLSSKTDTSRTGL